MLAIAENINAWTKRYIKAMIESIQSEITTNASTGNFDVLAVESITPVNAVAAAKVLTLSGNVSNNNTVACGGVTYTFKTALTSPAVANEVLIGASAEASIDNLVLAITAGSGAGTNYGTGTVVNPLATAAKASASTMTATNKIKGTVGNSTAIAENGANTTWAGGATTLSGGVNGTEGVTGQFTHDGTYLYICTDTNTIADANWKRLGSLASF